MIHKRKYVSFIINTLTVNILSQFIIDYIHLFTIDYLLFIGHENNTNIKQHNSSIHSNDVFQTTESWIHK